MTADAGVDAAVIVVGGGPAGLSAARELAGAGVGRVLVLEREGDAGGIPRHADHQGFGLRDLHRALPGPRYAAHLAQRAREAGAEILLHTQVTGWTPQGALEVTGPAGRRTLRGRAVLLATGCRERPRSARLIAGDRPQGVMTTGTLQQLVAAGADELGSRALVVGAEHVSFSALETLRHAGARTVAMTTELPRHQSFAAFRLGARVRYRLPLHTRTRLEAIHGHGRVEGVTLRDLATGARRELACDLVVLTADWIPDHELAVRAGLGLDPGTRGPRVDGAARTSRPGVFAAGNLLHGAETADVAALGGRHAARAIAEHLAGGGWPGAGVPIVCEAPLHWIVPGVVSEDRPVPSRGRFLLRSHEQLRDVSVELRQDGVLCHRQRLPALTPGRSAAVAAGWCAAIDPGGGPIRVTIAAARRGR
jgi:thioredoxin reductase